MPEETTRQEDPQGPQSNLVIPPTRIKRGASSGSADREAKEPKRVGFKSYLLLIVLTFAVFGPILNSDLLWSDYDEVERTPYLSMETWVEAWSVDTIKRYDPITLSSYFLESHLPLPTALAHRLINILLHLTAALFLLKILESLKLFGAYAATLVFALHPAVLQTLFWPGYRNELVGLVFILASLYFGIRNRDSRDFIFALLLTFISTLLHPAALVLPALLALAVFFQHKSFHLRHYNRILPLACITLFVAVWTQSGNYQDHDSEELSSFTQAGQNINFYLQHCFFPLDLRLFHPFSEGQTYRVGAANNLLILFFFVPFYVLIGFNFRKRWAKGIFLGLSSFLLLLLHGMGYTGRFIDGSLAKEEHVIYVALPVVAALTFCSCAGFFESRKALGRFLWPIGFSLFLLIQIGLTASYSYSVSDPAKMWKTLSEQWEDSWQPKAALVESVRSTGSQEIGTSEMIRILEAIVETNPNRHRERIHLARSYRESGQNANALREYRAILRDTKPENEILEEAATLMDKLGLSWEANNARERIDN